MWCAAAWRARHARRFWRRDGRVEVLIRRSCALHDRRAGCVAYNPSMQSSAAVASGGDATGSSLPLPLHGCLPPIRITRALTLRQPWAWAVAAGHKDVENRTWQTPHRGWLAIHAGGEWADSGAVALCTQLLDDAGVAIPPKQHLIRSAIIAVVFVEDCIAPDTPLQSPWAQPHNFHWLLRGAVLLPTPVPCAGSREVWKLSKEQSDAVEAQLAYGLAVED